MARVDGVVTGPDAYGKIQGNGGAVDKMAGDATNDQLQGHAEFNQYYGGAGNDTFFLAAKFGHTEPTATRDFSKLATYITDFQGADGDTPNSGNVGDHDFVHLSGFGAGSTLEYLGESNSGSSTTAKMYSYAVHDTTTGQYFNFLINSLNGQKLGENDYHFYA